MDVKSKRPWLDCLCLRLAERKTTSGICKTSSSRVSKPGGALLTVPLWMQSCSGSRISSTTYFRGKTADQADQPSCGECSKPAYTTRAAPSAPQRASPNLFQVVFYHLAQPELEQVPKGDKARSALGGVAKQASSTGLRGAAPWCCGSKSRAEGSEPGPS